MKALDLSGQKFGKLTAIKVISTGKKRIWLCECECGAQKEVLTFSLTAGHTKSCGCLLKLPTLMFRKINKLTVVHEFYRNGRKHVQCSCDCGSKKLPIIEASKFLSGVQQGCGCQKIGTSHPKARKTNGDGVINRLYSDYVNNAKNRNLEFDLSKDFFRILVLGNCFYCGRIPYKEKRIGFDKLLVNGVDRVDNSKGYVAKNVEPCCHECNLLKKDMEFNRFILLIQMIFNNRGCNIQVCV